MNNSMKKTRIMAVTAMLTAISILLSYIESPAIGFLKLDLSFFPALIGSFTMSPLSGMAVVIVTQLIRLITSSTAFIGELANVLMGCSLVGVAGVIYKIKKTRKTAVIGMAAGTLLMTIVASFMNYFVLIPFYENLFPIDVVIEMCSAVIPPINSKTDIILMLVVPFNIVKGLLISLITFIVYKPLSPVIHGKV